LSAVVLMYVQVFHINWQYRLEKELAALKSRQAELLERDYRTLNRAYAVNARLFHDFHNHLGVLRQFLSHERYGEALQYLDELHAPVR
ncbi:ATP-binding protein, partial [Klebsiella oxytoca]